MFNKRDHLRTCVNRLIIFSRTLCSMHLDKSGLCVKCEMLWVSLLQLCCCMNDRYSGRASDRRFLPVPFRGQNLARDMTTHVRVSVGVLSPAASSPVQGV